MSNKSKTICFVTPAHLANNPRLVKEATAAELAGYRIRIIAGSNLESTAEFDTEILRQHPDWDYVAIRSSKRDSKICWLWFKSRVRQILASAGFQIGFKGLFAVYAQSRLFREFLKEAVRKPVDLFIGHNLASLPVVFYASQKCGRPFGFDLEDAYSVEFSKALEDADPLARYLESRYLHKASFLTASSPGIAEFYEKAYGIFSPTVVLNTFPWNDRLSNRTEQNSKSSGNVALYWFSQTIGLDRGIQDVLKALAALDHLPVELHLRGNCSSEVKRKLLYSLKSSSLSSRIYFYPQVSPLDLLAKSSDYDIGLAVEQPVSLNRELCITNKLFFYLLAGLAIIATETTGQMSILSQIHGIGEHYPAGDIEKLKKIIVKLVSDKEILNQCKKQSLWYAREKFNWELESQKFFNLIQQVT